MQGISLQVLGRRQAQKAAVHRAGEDPIFDLVIKIAGDHLKLDIGVEAAEALEDAGQPLGGHAGKGGHLYKAGVHALQALHGLHHGVVGGAELLDPGQQRTAVRREHNAAPIAAEERDSQLVLQRIDGVTDAGLGEIHGLRRLGKAAAGRRFQKDLILCNAHGVHLSLRPLYHTSCHTFKNKHALHKC